MSNFSVPSFDNAPREAGFLPAKGRQDVTVTSIECKRSSKGDPQMVWTETIDNGPDANATLKEYFTFSDGNNITWARLANICDAAGFAWQEASSLEAFAAQFPINRLRFSVEVDYRYVIKAFIDVDNQYRYKTFAAQESDETPYEHWIQVQEHEFEAWKGERRGPFAQVRDGMDFGNIYQKAQNPPELKFEEDEDELAAAEAAMAESDGPFPF